MEEEKIERANLLFLFHDAFSLSRWWSFHSEWLHQDDDDNDSSIEIGEQEPITRRMKKIPVQMRDWDESVRDWDELVRETSNQMAFLALFFYIQVEMKRKDEDKKDTTELSDHAHHD